MLPFLLYNSIFTSTGVVVTHSSEATGYPAENAFDWRWGTVYAWKANATTTPAYLRGQLASTTCDACVIGGHNLKSAGATVNVRHSANATDWTTDATLDCTTWVDEYPIALSWTGSSAEYWEIQLTHASAFAVAPRISVATLGQKFSFLTMPPDLDPYAEEPATDWVDADSGGFLGANFRFRRKNFTLNLGEAGYGTTEWFNTVTRNFDRDFMIHARKKPFWFCWDLDTDTRGTVYCRLDGGFSSPFVCVNTRRTLSLPLTGFLPAVDW